MAPFNGSRIYHNFVANVITSDVKTVTERRDRNSNNQLARVLLLTIHLQFFPSSDFFYNILGAQPVSTFLPSQ